MKHGPKRAELVQLMQKFLPRCRVVIFRNERTRSTPLCPNSSFGVFRSVWMYFGLFCYCTNLDTKRAELVQLMQNFLPRSRIGIFRNECTRSTPLDPKLIFCASHCFWVRFGLFYYCTKLVAKRVELVQLAQKFVPRSHVRIFLQRTQPIHPIAP